MESKRIILLGAGYGGILTAKKLAKKFEKNQSIEIIIIDRKPYHTMLTELHEVAANRVPEDAIRINLEKIFVGRKVNVVLDEITNMDFEKKELIGNHGSYKYDYLVIGTGSKPTFWGCKGAKEHSFTLWSYEDAVKIKHQVLEMFRKASTESDEEKRAKLLKFVIVGGGFTGVEMAGELGEWKQRLCKNFNISEEEVKIYLVDMVPKILPMFNDRLINKSLRRLRKLGVEVLTNTNITEVKNNVVCINGNEYIDTFTTIWAAGVEGSNITEKMDIEKQGRNRIVTNDKLQAMEHENVFVVGDNIFYIPEGEERPVPQMVENAEHSAATVAHNVAASIQGNEQKTYKPVFHGAMVCIGGKYGVAQVGTPKRMYSFSWFIALFIKHFINVIYFIQVAGFNKVWSYMMHEFFHVPDRRSLVGGYFSKRSPNFWLVPLRVFIGGKWLLEGLSKVPGLIKDPTYIFLIPSKIEGITGATIAEGEAIAEKALPVPEIIQKVVDWSMGLIFYTPEGDFTFMATIFQIIMVILEIVIGLCLIAGLFTAVASIVSIGMGLMIWSSGMAPYEMLWYISGAIATIGGAGSTFSLDYYVLPFLKKYWKKIKCVRKWYLYTD